jgi:hypothetical protein
MECDQMMNDMYCYTHIQPSAKGQFNHLNDNWISYIECMF